jgi:hypothetical protein
MAAVFVENNNLNSYKGRGIIPQSRDFAPLSEERKQENNLLQDILLGFKPSVWFNAEDMKRGENSQKYTPINLVGNDIKKTLLFASGKPLTVSAVAQKLSEVEEYVEQLRQNRQLIGIPAEGYGYLYPAFQFKENGSILADLEKLLKSLDRFDIWMQLQFLQTGDFLLEGATPIEVLKQGRLEQALFAAENYAEMRAT